MAMFPVNPLRRDPYKNFKFLVRWDGNNPVAAISKVSALKRSTEVITHRDGGMPSQELKSPGQTKYEAITLERGVTQDLAFQNWANKVWNYSSTLGSEVSLKDFRRNITIELLNEAGQTVLTYHVYRCWVSEFIALPELDAKANLIAIQHLKLENEGWELDVSQVEPQELSLGPT